MDNWVAEFIKLYFVFEPDLFEFTEVAVIEVLQLK
jgi:hypothetical protein